MKKIFLFLFVFLVFSSVMAEEISREEAVQSILDSENVLVQLQEQGYATILLEDTLQEAKLVLERTDYAEVLRGNSNFSSYADASSYLKLLDWKSFSYSDVFIHTERISELNSKIYDLSDKILLWERKLDQAKEESTRDLFFSAKESFEAERYVETEGFLEEFELALEKEAQGAFLARSLARNFLQLIKENLLFFSVLLIVLIALIHFSSKTSRKTILKKKIKRKEAEAWALKDLLRNTQEERYKKNKISEYTYKVRSKLYTEKIQALKSEIPILREKLRKI